jgi:hypothetical protein
VSHWDGSRWEAWTKPKATLKAFGNNGELTVVKVDRGHELVWAGGYDGDTKSMHWNSGQGVHAALNWCSLVACSDSSWQHKLWPEEGQVAALELDPDGNLWAGVHRDGNGIVPPVAGIKLFDGTDWFEYTPANSGLSSNEVTAIERAGDMMWVGLLNRGVSVYHPEVLPTATPFPSDTPAPSATVTPIDTDEPTPTPVGAICTCHLRCSAWPAGTARGQPRSRRRFANRSRPTPRPRRRRRRSCRRRRPAPPSRRR